MTALRDKGRQKFVIYLTLSKALAIGSQKIHALKLGYYSADGWTTRWVKSCCWMMGLRRNQLMGLLHLPVKMLQESVMGPVLLNTFINDLERQWSANSPGLQVTPNWGNCGYTQE